MRRTAIEQPTRNPRLAVRIAAERRVPFGNFDAGDVLEP
jgi:hypothetical protein